MRVLDLDALLGTQFPKATFHDSELEAIVINFVDDLARLDFAIPTDWDDPEYPMRHGVLELGGLHAFSIEAPREITVRDRRRVLWITADGPLPDPKIRIELPIPNDLPDEAFCHYLFASNTNSFVMFAANVAEWTWSEEVA